MRLHQALQTAFGDLLPGVWLAIDGSTSDASIALYGGGLQLVQKTLPAQALPSEHLVDALAEVAAGHGVQWKDLGGIVVGLGPGSFTGLRVVLSTVKGIALGVGCPVVGTSSMAMHAASVLGGDEPSAAQQANPRSEQAEVLVVRDARRNNVYAGTYRFDPRQGVVGCVGESLMGIDQALPLARGRWVCGDGATLLAARDDCLRIVTATPDAAWGYLLEAGRVQASDGDDLELLSPRYLQSSLSLYSH